MILHDFTYEWDGKSHSGKKPISWWPGRYQVRILKIGDETSRIQYLFPFAVVFKSAKTNAVMNTSLENYIHNFAEKISREYDLDMEKVMWVKMDDPVMVAHLTPDRKLSGTPLYTISWRTIRPNETAVIAPDITDF